MKKKRCILSLLLAVILTVSTWSVPVFAAAPQEDRTMKSGETITVTEETIVKFVPEKSGTYYFTSEWQDENADPKCWLLNKDGNELDAYDDDELDELGERKRGDFQGKYDFTAGETYYFKVGYYSASYIGTYNFSLFTNRIVRQPKSEDPSVGLLSTAGAVTCQWYEVGEEEKITDDNADAVGSGVTGNSAYSEATGKWSAGSWIPATNIGADVYKAFFFAVDVQEGETFDVKVEGGDVSRVELVPAESMTGGYSGVYDEDENVYKITAGGSGLFVLSVYNNGNPESAVEVSAGRTKPDKCLTQETGIALRERKF